MNKLIVSMGIFMIASVADAQTSPVNVVQIDATGLRTEVITFGDLNLSNVTGIATLYMRITHASELVCGEGNSSSGKSLLLRSQERKCRNDAIKLAVGNVHNQALLAYWQKQVYGEDRAELAKIN